MISSTALAFDSANPRDARDYMHFTGGALSQYGAYGVWKQVTGDKTAGFILGLLTTAGVCIGKEATDKRFSKRDLGYCGAGAAAAGVSIPLFGF